MNRRPPARVSTQRWCGMGKKAGARTRRQPQPRQLGTRQVARAGALAGPVPPGEPSRSAALTPDQLHGPASAGSKRGRRHGAAVERFDIGGGDDASGGAQSAEDQAALDEAFARLGARPGDAPQEERAQPAGRSAGRASREETATRRRLAATVAAPRWEDLAADSDEDDLGPVRSAPVLRTVRSAPGRERERKRERERERA